ncbi:MAG: sulfurtransferase TusA family protein [Gammaproteobacteria bacterium]|nr:sulfurtransferase TusA family protein [Gammaproteobacteria bacterium]
MSHYELDARRLLCPLPVIRTQNKIKTLSVGDQLLVICTDPGAENDIPAWCRINGHKLVSIDHEDRELKILIEVSNVD